MIANVFLQVTNFITHTIDVLGYPGVVLLMAIESAAIPLPSEIIMPFAGFLVASGRFNLMGLGLAGALGSLIGSLVTYALGYWGGRALIVSYGKYVLISEHDLNLTERFFARFGKWSTFLGRVLPVVRTFISIPTGIGQEPLGAFTVLTFIGSFIWSYFLAYLGMRLGEHWRDLEVYFRKFDVIIVIVIVIAIIFWIRRHLKRH